mmetsp:Transcript_5585/g.12854  ORF Transcript_5585/g.12854 Transcript_5585/m.12854 type:complete len:231 (-) Transcript_5585:7-699(-)
MRTPHPPFSTRNLAAHSSDDDMFVSMLVTLGDGLTRGVDLPPDRGALRMLLSLGVPLFALPFCVLPLRLLPGLLRVAAMLGDSTASTGAAGRKRPKSENDESIAFPRRSKAPISFVASGATTFLALGTGVRSSVVPIAPARSTAAFSLAKTSSRASRSACGRRCRGQSSASLSATSSLSSSFAVLNLPTLRSATCFRKLPCGGSFSRALRFEPELGELTMMVRRVVLFPC